MTIETLTFLFTDIEGSTALLGRIGSDGYASVLADHNEIIRHSINAHGGTEVGTSGDSFFITFTSASECVAGAIEAQRSLSDHTWPADEQLRVRMGIHTGEASGTPTGPIGYEVHRAARIGAVAHGGQVLVSAPTAALVEGTLPGDASLRGLGPHRLKDLGRPEILFQLVAQGLIAKFPPLRSLDNPELPNNLPASLSPFVGRHDELAELRVLAESSRLVTLTGAGGVGKTRLALQVAAELLDGTGEGVWYIELAPVAGPEQVASAVIEAMQLRHESGTERDTVLHALKEQDLLLVFDNCEHVIDEMAKFADLIVRTCPKVSILATSREPLGVDGEQVYRVRSLSLPSADVESSQDLEGSDAVEMFLARARLQESTFDLDDANAWLLGSVCRRLDGIPLAIELAAARLSSMSLADVNDRLDQRFRLLTGGSRNALPRQQTLGATVAWSYDLLSEPERAVLRRLTAFVDGFDLQAAEAVCTSDSVDAFDVAVVLGSLVNKSLVNTERTVESVRFSLLETIRQFAAEQLLQVDGEEQAEEVRGLHAEFYLRFLEEAEPRLRCGSDQVSWLNRLDDEWGNIQVALAHFGSDPTHVGEVLRLGVAGVRYFDVRHRDEPRRPMLAALAADDQVPAFLRARALAMVGTMRWDRVNDDEDGDMLAARARLEEALGLARTADDRRLVVEVLTSLSFLAKDLGEDDRAVELAGEALSLATALGDVQLLGWATMQKGIVSSPVGYDRRAAMLESAELFRQCQDSAALATALLLASARVSESLEEMRVDRALNEEGIEVAERVGHVTVLSFLLGNLAEYCYFDGEIDTSDALNRRAIQLMRRTGWEAFWFNSPLLFASYIAARRGESTRSAQLLGAHDELHEQSPDYYDSNRWISSKFEEEAEHRHRLELAEALGAEEFERAQTIGRNLTLGSMLNLALGRAVPAD